MKKIFVSEIQRCAGDEVVYDIPKNEVEEIIDDAADARVISRSSWCVEGEKQSKFFNLKNNARFKQGQIKKSLLMIKKFRKRKKLF